MTYPFKILNAKTRTSEKFYLEFFRIKENISNVLGRQVYSVTIPDISFEEILLRKGRSVFVDKGKMNTGPLQVTFKDDEDSVVDTVLAAQVLRQLHNIHFENDDDEVREYRFDVKIRKYGANGLESLGFMVHDCLIMGYNHNELSYAQDNKSLITTTISFDRMEILIPDKFKEVLNIDDVKHFLPSRKN